MAFPLVDDPKTALLVWTTTPWTLPSNMYAAVHPELDYAFVTGAGERTLIVAKGLLEPLAKKLGAELTVVREAKGKDLVGTRYVPPFDTFAEEAKAHPVIHSVIAAPFVLLDASGIVHIAPAFGEDDFKAHRALVAPGGTLPLFNAVKPDGTFGDVLPKYAGRFVKDCDKDLQKELKERGILVHAELYRHEYPFCWRADSDPLIQYARPAWYIRTTQENAAAIANNRAIQWLPDHIKEGRFGDFLRNNVDWALSRERYWGTPLNIWVNDVTGNMESPASVAEIEQKNPSAFLAFDEARKKQPGLSEHLRVHKPWIDHVTWQNPGEEGVYRRVPDVIDCWFDSGCMPFAQWGYPHAPGSKESFEKAFPADFISEAIDQTRGWFYSLLMVSTLVFDEATQKKMGLASMRPFPHPYKTCVVLGHICDKEGKKESKSKGNYTPPEIILDRVRMEFAVLRASEVSGLEDKPNTAYVAREDYEGLDLTGESSQIALYRAGTEDECEALTTLVPTKLLPRRVVAVSSDMPKAKGLSPRDATVKVMPTEVPRLPPDQKVFIEDRAASAPGADAFRWFFFASSPSWSNTRHSLTNVRLEQKEFLVKLRNVFSFFTIYAEIDGFDPSRGNAAARAVSSEALSKSEGYRPMAERNLLDRWMLSELAITNEKVVKALDAYQLYDAARALVDLTEALSNWYVRQSRSRFWAPGRFGAAIPGATGEHVVAGQDKADAYFTLYEVLVTMARMAAPFVPFFADELYQNLVRGPWPTSQPESVHLVAYPVADAANIDTKLAREMSAVREIVSLGLQVRMAHKLSVQLSPLSAVDLLISDEALGQAVISHADLIADELHVDAVKLLAPGQEASMVSYVLKPNFRALGPKLGKKMQLAKAELAKRNAAEVRAELASKGTFELELGGEKFVLSPDEIEVSVEAKEGFAAAGGKVGVVVLDVQVTDELRDRGLARGVLARVQALRKELALAFTDRIKVHLSGSERVERVARANRAVFEKEALADSVVVGDEGKPAGEHKEVSIAGETLLIRLERVSRG